MNKKLTWTLKKLNLVVKLGRELLVLEKLGMLVV